MPIGNWKIFPIAKPLLVATVALATLAVVGVGFFVLGSSPSVLLQPLVRISDIGEFKVGHGKGVVIHDGTVYAFGILKEGGVRVVSVDVAAGTREVWEDSDASWCYVHPSTMQVFVKDESSRLRLQSLDPNDTSDRPTVLLNETRGNLSFRTISRSEVVLRESFLIGLNSVDRLVIFNLNERSVIQEIDLNGVYHRFHRAPSGQLVSAPFIPDDESAIAYEFNPSASAPERPLSKRTINPPEGTSRLLGLTGNGEWVIGIDLWEHSSIKVGERTLRLASVLGGERAAMVLGEYLVYEDRKGPKRGLHVMDLDTGKDRRVSFADYDRSITHIELHDARTTDQVIVTIGDAVYLLKLPLPAD